MAPEGGERSGSDVLAGVLSATDEVQHVLVDRALVHHTAWNTLRHLHIIFLTGYISDISINNTKNIIFFL